MAAKTTGRTAQTDFRVIEHLHGYSLLEVRIATGRTHQIRVHMKDLGHVILGDEIYGWKEDPRLPVQPARVAPVNLASIIGTAIFVFSGWQGWAPRTRWAGSAR